MGSVGNAVMKFMGDTHREAEAFLEDPKESLDQAVKTVEGTGKAFLSKISGKGDDTGKVSQTPKSSGKEEGGGQEGSDSAAGSNPKRVVFGGLDELDPTYEKRGKASLRKPA